MHTDPNPQGLLFVIGRAAPAENYLDAVMTATLLNQATSVLFVGDGARALHNAATREQLASLLTLGSLELFVTASEVDEPPGKELPLQQLDSAAARALFSRHERVLSF